MLAGTGHGMESVSGWEKWFKEKGHLYERIFSDEELAVMAIGDKENKNTFHMKGRAKSW